MACKFGIFLARVKITKSLMNSIESISYNVFYVWNFWENKFDDDEIFDNLAEKFLEIPSSIQLSTEYLMHSYQAKKIFHNAWIHKFGSYEIFYFAHGKIDDLHQQSEQLNVGECLNQCMNSCLRQKKSVLYGKL